MRLDVDEEEGGRIPPRKNQVRGELPLGCWNQIATVNVPTAVGNRRALLPHNGTERNKDGIKAVPVGLCFAP